MPFGVHGARDVDVFARWDADPNGLMESALLEGKFGTVILRAVGVRATLPWEVFVAIVSVVFEREGFRLPLGSFLLLDFGVHVISFPTGSRPIYNRDTVVCGILCVIFCESP